MTLLLALDYLLGFMAYHAFDFLFDGWDAFVLYFFALIAIEVVVCQSMIKINSLRAKAYATLNIIAIPVHVYGLIVFIMMLDYKIYESLLMSLLCAKIVAVVMPDVRNSVRHCYDSIRDRLVGGGSFLFATENSRREECQA